MAYRVVWMAGLLALALGACAEADRDDDLELTDPVYPRCSNAQDCSEGGYCLEDGNSFEDGEDGSSWNLRLSTCAYDCATDEDCPGTRGRCVETYGTPRCVLPCDRGCGGGMQCEWYGADICMWPDDDLECTRNCD